ncbi:MAG: hypothetical protein U1F43_22330 [Myxococcota bacterium]
MGVRAMMLAAVVALAATVLACDEPGGRHVTSTITTEPPPRDTTQEPPPPPRYYAIVVDDSDFFDGRCETSGSQAHGADIDAVELGDGSGASLGYFENVVYRPGTVCDVASGAHADADAVKGAPDGTLSDGFVSLGGGFVAGELGPNQLEVRPGYTVTVYEVGDEACAAAGLTAGVDCVGDERYAVSLITELGCLTDGGCEELLVTGRDGAEGEAEIPLAGF